MARLAENLGIPVIEVQANRRRGIQELKAALVAARAEATGAAVARSSPFPDPFCQEVAALCQRLAAAPAVTATRQVAQGGERQPNAALPRYLVERLLLDTTGYLEDVVVGHADPGLHTAIQDARERLAAAGCQVPAVEAVARYGWVAKVLDRVVTRPATRPVTWGDRRIAC